MEAQTTTEPKGKLQQCCKTQDFESVSPQPPKLLHLCCGITQEHRRIPWTLVGCLGLELTFWSLS